MFSCPILPIKGFIMNELTVVDKTSDWRRMKSLVLDSVLSPITKTAYNSALDECLDWYQREPRPPAREECQEHWGPGWKLAFAQAGAGAPERARHHDAEGAARPRHYRCAPGLRSPALGGGGAYDGAHTTARWPVVHRRFVREARACADHSDADVGQSGNRRLDRPRWRRGRIRVPAGRSRRSGARRRAV